jgi:hypothetical protein
MRGAIGGAATTSTTQVEMVRWHLAMIMTQRDTAGDRRVGAEASGNAASLGLADWLCLAAAPTFGMMAVLTCVLDAGPGMLCSAAHSASPLSGMVPMYWLMSVFHLAPWVTLMSDRRGRGRRSWSGS